MNNRKWLVSVGFATGAPQNRNASWFLIKDYFFSETRKGAIEQARKQGYNMNDDICADWLFSCKEEK